MMLDVRDLYFAYGDRQVLRGITFSVDKGELVSVLGPNGVGKSTLFQCILGIHKKFSGEIEIEGRSVLEMGARSLAQRIAYIPQSHYPALHYSVLDMVLMGTAAQFSSVMSPGKQQLDIARWALDKIGIGDFAQRDFMRISGGERQLVLIARALAQQSRMLIMDEPTANLDYGNQVRVLTQIEALAKDGFTILKSTHNPEHAYLYSSRIVAMRNGALAANGTPGETLTSELIRALYGIDAHVQSLYDDAVRICVPERFEHSDMTRER